jgi:hypothetical protein
MSPAAPSIDEIRRLAVVRHLYNLGVEQSRGAEPLSGLAILPFHDAAEMFLQLLCERYDAGENKLDFMKYWELLTPKGIVVTQRETMRRLNAARRTLKHQGLLPAHIELEGFRAATTNFLYENSAQFMGIPFDRVSLVDLVPDDDVKIQLRLAEERLAAGKFADAMGEIAVAFYSLLDMHRDRPSPTIRPSGTPFRIDQLVPTFRMPSSRMGKSMQPEAMTLITDFSSSVEKMGNGLVEALTIVAYGLDFDRYLLFKSCSPVVHRFPGGPKKIQWLIEWHSGPEVVQECLEFVVDAAFRLNRRIIPR